jgi:hypothetical protein
MTIFCALSIFSTIISYSTVGKTLYTSWNISHNSEYEDTDEIKLFDKIGVHLAISQDDNTTTTNTTTTTDTTTTEDKNTTQSFTPWKPFIEASMYYPLALIFSVLGILSTLWLIFFVETSKDRTIRERIFGSTIRLIVMSILLGLALHFWILFEPI